MNVSWRERHAVDALALGEPYGKARNIIGQQMISLSSESNNQLFAAVDITSIRLHGGFIYLVAVMEWCSRYVLSWAVSITIDVGFC